jgi:hypothetical protein
VEEAQKEAIRVVAQQDANLRLNQG